MRKLIDWVMVFALVLALAFGCKTVKRSETSSKQSNSESVSEKISVIDTAAIVTNFSRSLDTKIKQHVAGKLTVYPRGEFTVLPDGTFKGQADSVVSNQTKVLEETRSERDTLQETQAVGSQTAAETSSDKSDESESEDLNLTREPSIMPWIGAAVAVILVVIGLSLYFKKGRW